MDKVINTVENLDAKVIKQLNDGSNLQGAVSNQI